MKCDRCGLDIQQGMNNCPHCGNLINYYDSNLSSEREKVNVLLVILSFFFPIVGLIFFFVFLGNAPKTAKTCGLVALITVVVEILVTVLFFSLIFLNINKVVVDNKIDNDSYDVIYEDNKDDEMSYDSDVSDIIVSNVSNNWKSYQISYNGKNFNLPVSYSDFFVNTGFTFKSLNEDISLKPNYYAIVNLYKNDKLGLTTEVYNDKGIDSNVSNGMITRISQNKYHVSNNVGQVVFPGSLKVGDSITEDKLISLFGQFNDKKTYGNTTTYSYNEDTLWTTTNYYKIEVVNGVIEQLTLDNR